MKQVLVNHTFHAMVMFKKRGRNKILDSFLSISHFSLITIRSTRNIFSLFVAVIVSVVNIVVVILIFVAVYIGSIKVYLTLLGWKVCKIIFV